MPFSCVYDTLANIFVIGSEKKDLSFLHISPNYFVILEEKAIFL